MKSVDLVLDGVTVQTLRDRPWKTTFDFGAELLPRELVAIAHDSKGEELSRASQIMNVPRPRAEIDIQKAADAIRDALGTGWLRGNRQSRDSSSKYLANAIIPPQACCQS